MTTETQNNLDDEFITYEQALALKELGFNNTCFKKSVHKKKCDNKDEKGNCPLHNIHCGYPDCEIDKTIEPIRMPTYRQAFKFFREKFKIEAHVVFKQSQEGGNIIGYSFDVVHPVFGQPLYEGHIMDVYIEWGQHGYKHPSYEAAELACLNKLIKLAKNDKGYTK